MAATKASVRTFILSDIIGDPVELIASGPTVETTIKDRSFYEGLLRQDLKSLNEFSSKFEPQIILAIFNSDDPLLKSSILKKI